MVVKITPNDKGNPPGKLADAELHFGTGALAGGGLVDLEAVFDEALGDGCAQGLLVFDDQEMYRVIRHLSKRQYLDGWLCARQAVKVGDSGLGIGIPPVKSLQGRALSLKGEGEKLASSRTMSPLEDVRVGPYDRC